MAYRVYLTSTCFQRGAASAASVSVGAGMNPNAYPFTTRRQILERIESEPAFATQCVAVLQDRC